LPDRSISDVPGVDARTRRPVPSRNVSVEKATSFMRPSVTVLAPHSMSAWPLLMAVKRFCDVTGTHLTCNGDTPTWRSITLMTPRHTSTV
jgi:hypothetical protein